MLADSEDDQHREHTYLNLFEEQRAFGVVLAPSSDHLAVVQRLCKRDIPVVLLDHQSGDQSVPSVAVDNVAEGRMATQHLLDIGCRRLVFVGGPLALRQVSDRLVGAESSIMDTPAATDFEVIRTAALTILEGRRVGAAIANRPAKNRPDTIFAANDLLAIGVLQELVMSRTIRIPDDIAIIGYDDIDYAASAIVPLTSIRQPAALLGTTAVGLLLMQAKGTAPEPSQVLYQPELVVRTSTVLETPPDAFRVVSTPPSLSVKTVPRQAD